MGLQPGHFGKDGEVSKRTVVKRMPVLKHLCYVNNLVPMGQKFTGSLEDLLLARCCITVYLCWRWLS